MQRVVRECAVAACSADPRFPPLGVAELAGLQIEVSLLGARAVASPDEINWAGTVWLSSKAGSAGCCAAGRDRMAVGPRDIPRSHLPQGRSARDAWKRGAKVWRFEAEVFGELNTTDTMDPKEEK